MKKRKERDRLAAALGLTAETIGKTEARQRFLPLVDTLADRATVVEITDRDRPVAVLVSYNHWIAVLSKLAMAGLETAAPPGNLIGSVEIVADLDAASRRAGRALRRSAARSATRL